MSPFQHALDTARIVDAHDLPADPCFQSTAVIMGPTAVDFSMLPQGAARIPASERARVKDWNSRSKQFHQRKLDRPAFFSGHRADWSV